LTQFTPHGCYGVFADWPGLHGHVLRLTDGLSQGSPLLQKGYDGSH
jgi:hypothetical protein